MIVSTPLGRAHFVDPRLTKRQKQVLDFVKLRLAETGVPPSTREIGQAVGLSSSSTVHSHLKALKRKGQLDNDKNSPRSLRLVHRVDILQVWNLLDRWAATGASEELATETIAMLQAMRGTA